MTHLLFDANSILNRAFYGIRPLTTHEGLNTNAIYGFLTILRKHTARFDPCDVTAAFDRKEKTYRHEMYEGYKAGRHAMPDELREQFPVLKEVLTAMGIRCIEKPGLEADDIIGTLSRRFTANGDDCMIVTGDRDSFQLITDKVTVCLASTGEDSFFDIPALKEKYGLLPSQMTDLKALMGDSSDNIPGVPGIGEKTALSLLGAYGSLDGVYAHTDELKGAVQRKIIDGKESAYISKKLGTIITDADLDAELSAPVSRSEEAMRALFNRLEMASMFEKFGLEAPVEEIPPMETAVEDRDTVPDGDTLFLLAAEDAFLIACDDTVYRVPATDDVLRELSMRRIVTHDAKPLIRRFLRIGSEGTVVFDTMLAGYLLDPSRPSYPFPVLCSELLGENALRPVTDADCAFLLKTYYEAAKSELDRRGQTDLYFTIELPLCTVLARMEHVGFPADRAFLEQFGKTITHDIDDLSEAIFLLAGREFNINSTKQLGTILFEELHMPVIRKTKTGYSTDNDVLEELYDKTGSPLIADIMDYRKLVKLRSTYVDGMVTRIDDEGRIHTVFTQNVTQTGRISSTEPNLQNIPVRTKLGRELRRAFVAREGYTLIDADYSQIELRVLADIARDDAMIRAFREETDIHTVTASQVFGLPESMITPELRRRAKAVNFGIVYGIGEYSLSKDIGVTVREAKQYIQNYLATYSGVRSYMNDIVETGRRQGYVETKFARRRYVPDINAKNRPVRAFSERVCMNTPIQGTAADIIKLAMVNVDRKLKESGTDAHLILQVHDELIIECPEAKKEEIGKLLKEEMENAVRLAVPLTAEVGFGKTWYDAKG